MTEDETIGQLTERLSRSLTMTQNATTSSVNVPSGLNTIQKNQIREIVNEVLNTQQDPLLDVEVDQPVGTITKLEELDKIPDIVRSLRDFSGQPGEFSSWRKSVDRIMELYQPLQGTGRFYAILHTIRTKIVGDADTALESYRTPLDWGRIKKCLMMHYSDKRDIGTLEYQMTALCQGNRPITEFYQAVYQHLSLILDKVSCLDLDEGSLRVMTTTYRDKALDTFVRGLNGDLPRLLSVREPTSLPQALHICLKLNNMTFRMNYAHGQTTRGNVQKDNISARPYLGNKPRFHPELAHIGGKVLPRPPLPPRNMTTQNYNQNINWRPVNNQNWTPRPPYNQGNQQGFPNQYLRPQYSSQTTNNQQPSTGYEPMDVDRSVQTRQINYMNRPQNTAFKRPPTSSIQVPQNKIQRNFHVTTGNENIVHQPPQEVVDYHDEEGAVGGIPDIEEYYREIENNNQSFSDTIYEPPEYDPSETTQDDALVDLNFFG